MKLVDVKDLKSGDILYRVNPNDGKMLKYNIVETDGSWFELSNDTGICVSIQSHSINNMTNRNSFFTHPLAAIWSSIRNICDKQYELEKKRVKIITENKIKVTIDGNKEKKLFGFITIKKK